MSSNGSLFGAAILRIKVLPGDRVQVERISSDGNATARRETVNLSDLPEHVLHKLAVLNTRSYTPPTELVERVGRRISRDMFWVFDEE